MTAMVTMPTRARQPATHTNVLLGFPPDLLRPWFELVLSEPISSSCEYLFTVCSKIKHELKKRG